MARFSGLDQGKCNNVTFAWSGPDRGVELMHGLRAHRRPGALVALFALLLQLALSFGHLHIAHADQPGFPAVAASDPGSTPQPQHPDHDHDAQYCAIYAILALLTGAQAAAAPAVAMPATYATAVLADASMGVRLVARLDAFRSRAPPIS
jgi:hypothetical protein